MIVFSLLLLFLNSVVSAPLERRNDNLRVMTFNIWNSARNVENGQQKVAKHILLVNPDIVALQEVYLKVASNITEMLGPPWKFIEHQHPSYPDTVIITRHEIVPNTMISTKYGLGCEILLNSGKVVNFWNAHLDYLNYGPSEAVKKDVTNVSQIVSGEYIKRAPGMLEILNLPQFQKWLSNVSNSPIILCGDFNVPSHFDWTEETKHIHNNWIVEWPITRHLESYGFIDSFREVYPNVLEVPGFSWSTVHEFDAKARTGRASEPPDRVDFIFYRGPLTAFQSTMYAGNETLEKHPNHSKNDYPSDHFAFFTDFRFF